VAKWLSEPGVKKLLILSGLWLLICAAPIGAQTATPANGNTLKFLMGKWVGEGTAETGQVGGGWATFEPEVQGKIIMRKSHSAYPAGNGRPAIAHDDLMVIYPDAALGQLRALYSDNEGHVIAYTVTGSTDGKSVVFLGDVSAKEPRFRLTYTLTQPGHITIAFEIAQPDKPDQFQRFIEGKMQRPPAATK